MLTPISTKIEEFKEKFVLKTFAGQELENPQIHPSVTPEKVENFLRTALEQRDKEWRELVENEKEIYRSCITNGAPEIKDRKERKLYTWSMEDSIKALDDIITKSKEI